MKILPITKQIVYQKNTTFGVNLASPKLAYELEDFFVNISGYDRNMYWANSVKKTANQAVTMIRQKADFENVIHHITDGAKYANKLDDALGDKTKAKLTGIIRCSRPTWENSCKTTDNELYTPYGIFNNRYNNYELRLNRLIKKPLKNAYGENISLSTIVSAAEANTYCNYIVHGKPGKINDALDYVASFYQKLQNNYVNKNITNKDLHCINNLIARSRWILAHSTPWCRGSDFIGNIYTRALYKAIGIKAYPLKEGVSLDLEAFCTPLEEYVKNFPTYFEKAPEIAE
ncbi:MAG: hypothetical protein MJ231_06775 [bacterium]|nr:hypothetical protein [bacterium]